MVWRKRKNLTMRLWEWLIMHHTRIKLMVCCTNSINSLDISLFCIILCVCECLCVCVSVCVCVCVSDKYNDLTRSINLEHL